MLVLALGSAHEMLVLAHGSSGKAVLGFRADCCASPRRYARLRSVLYWSWDVVQPSHIGCNFRLSGESGTSVGMKWFASRSTRRTRELSNANEMRSLVGSETSNT